MQRGERYSSIGRRPLRKGKAHPRLRLRLNAAGVPGVPLLHCVPHVEGISHL